MKATVRAVGKEADDVRVAADAGAVADEVRAFDLRGGDHGAFNRSAGNQDHRNHPDRCYRGPEAAEPIERRATVGRCVGGR